MINPQLRIVRKSEMALEVRLASHMALSDIE